MDTASSEAQDQVILHYNSESRWLCFRNPYQIVEAMTVEEVLPALRNIEAQIRKHGRYAAGFISYEASGAFDAALCTKPSTGFPLLWFGLYPPPEEVCLPEPDFNAYSLGKRIPSVSQPEYFDAISEIKKHIHSGDTYQVNYTLQLKLPFDGDPWNLFLAMVRAQSPGYAAWVDTGRYAVCSASPELFFTLERNRLVCKPMKGTVKRGRTLKEDKSFAEWLRNSEKNRAENVMIVDMIRNDLGRIAEDGSVRVDRLFEVERHPTLWQMTSTVRADSKKSLTEIMAALFPCASITGAPKVRTAQIIAELEATPRGLYTGCIGFIGPEPRAQFNVAIRTAVVDRLEKKAGYGTGGGIVWDSTRQDEYTEAILKSRVLTEQQPEFSLLETLLWTHEDGYFLLDSHMKRLADSAEYFGYSVNIDDIEAALLEKTNGFMEGSQKIRLLIDQNGSMEIQSSAIEPDNAHEKLRVKLAREPIHSKNIFLYHKTTFRTVYEAARKTCPGCDDVLLWNEREELTESSIANIVLELNGGLFTPPVQSGLLAGIFRGCLLDQGKVKERILYVSDLQTCERIFLINSVRKWQEAELI